jgi:hypothetical protein
MRAVLVVVRNAEIPHRTALNSLRRTKVRYCGRNVTVPTFVVGATKKNPKVALPLAEADGVAQRAELIDTTPF